RLLRSGCRCCQNDSKDGSESCFGLRLHLFPPLSACRLAPKVFRIGFSEQRINCRARAARATTSFLCSHLGRASRGDASVRQELAAGAVLRSGGRSAFGGKASLPVKTGSRVHRPTQKNPGKDFFFVLGRRLMCRANCLRRWPRSTGAGHVCKVYLISCSTNSLTASVASRRPGSCSLRAAGEELRSNSICRSGETLNQ